MREKIDRSFWMALIIEVPDKLKSRAHETCSEVTMLRGKTIVNQTK